MSHFRLNSIRDQVVTTNNEKLTSVQTFSSEQHIPAYSYYSFLRVHFGNFLAVIENKAKLDSILTIFGLFAMMMS